MEKEDYELKIFFPVMFHSGLKKIGFKITDITLNSYI